MCSAFRPRQTAARAAYSIVIEGWNKEDEKIWKAVVSFEALAAEMSRHPLNF